MIHFVEQPNKETQSQKRPPKHVVREAKEIREHLTESEIDKTLKDSFPASDPPGRY